MAEWTIFGKREVDGQQVTVAKAKVKELELHDEWMAQCYVTVTVKSAEPVDFAVGDYLDYRGERYAIQYNPTVLKKARRGTYGDGFTYDSIKFVHEAQSKIVLCDFTDIVLQDNDIPYTSLPTFPFFCQTVDDLLDRIQANLEELYPGRFTIVGLSLRRNEERGRAVGRTNDFIEAYETLIDPTSVLTDEDYGKTSVALTVDNINCWEALSKVNTEFDLNFIQRGYVIAVGTAGAFTTSKYRYGKGNGLYEIEKVGDSEQQIVTRLRAYGNETNLPLNYYANLHKHACFIVSKKEREVADYAGGLVNLRLYTDIPWLSVKEAFTTINTATLTYGVATAETGFYSYVKEGSDTKYLVFMFHEFDTYQSFYDAVDVGSKVFISDGVNINKWPTAYTETDGSAIEYPANLVLNRLMLPGFPDQSLYDWVVENRPSLLDEGFDFSTNRERPYIDSPNVALYGIRPASIYFDGSNETDDIHPTIEGMGVDSIYNAEQVMDSGVFLEGDVPGFKIWLPDLGFDLDEQWESGAAIEMKDGMCGGRKFEIASRPTKEGNLWVCNCKREEDQSLHLWFPYERFNISPNDKYVLTGINLPAEYITAASERLFDAAIEALRKNHAPRFTWQPRIDELWMQREHDEVQQMKEDWGYNGYESAHDTLKAGDLFRFADADLGVDEAIIIDVLTIKENGNNGIPTYEVTLRDEKQVSTIQKVLNKIDSMKASGGSGKSMTPAQIQDLLEESGSGLFLSKVRNDVANGEIGFMKGLWVKAKGLFGIDASGNGSFADTIVNGLLTAVHAVIDIVKSSNFTGHSATDSGWAITNNFEGTGRSRMTLDEIYVRGRAIFEELVIKQKQVTGGDILQSCAASYISRVDYLDRFNQPIGYVKAQVPWVLRGIVRFLPGYLGQQVLTKGTIVRRKITQKQIEEQVAMLRCYFLASDGDRKIDNWWCGSDANNVGHDLAFCQTFDLNDNFQNKRDPYGPVRSKAGNVRWWRRVERVGSNVTLDDGKVYHYFDVKYEYENEKYHVPTQFCEVGSDLPAPGDAVVQLGNDRNTDRMSAILMEVNGVGNPDSPSIKALYGIYTYSLQKCWFGGPVVRMVLSPRTGYKFYGPSFEFITQYDTTVHSPIDRGEWIGITETRDDFSPNGQVRKCYPYDRVSHNGCLWLCRMQETWYWAEPDNNGNFNAISDSDYASKTYAQKILCEHRQRYTIDEPSKSSSFWELQTSKGDTPIHLYKWYAPNTQNVQAPTVTAAQWNNNSLFPIDGWTKNAPNRPQEGWELYMSENTLLGDGTLDATAWTPPIVITGERGSAGEDAKEREWIYAYTEAGYNVTTGTAPDIDPDSPTYGQRIAVSGQTGDIDNCRLVDDFVPTDWSDNPNGISQNHPTEYASFRLWDKTNERWSSFYPPITWSHYGENGMDGDGLEYCFLRTKTNVAPVLVVESDSYTDSNGKTYDEDEFLPHAVADANTENNENRYECTDDAKGTNATFQYEWMAMRRMELQSDGKTRVWKKYDSDAMKIWKVRLLKNTIPYFKAYAQEHSAVWSTDEVPSSSSMNGWMASTTSTTWSEQVPFLYRIDLYYFDDNTTQWGTPGFAMKWAQRGENGKDGWVITANPVHDIVDQYLNDNNLIGFKDMPRVFTFNAVHGSRVATVTQVQIDSTETQPQDGVTWAIDENDDTRLLLTAIVPNGTDSSGNATYFDHTSRQVIVSATDSDETVHIPVRVYVYLNQLGTFERRIKNGVETAVGELRQYSLDDEGNVIWNKWLYDEVNSAKEAIRQLFEDKSVLQADLSAGSDWQIGGLDTSKAAGTVYASIKDDSVCAFRTKNLVELDMQSGFHSLNFDDLPSDSRRSGIRPVIMFFNSNRRYMGEYIDGMASNSIRDNSFIFGTLEDAKYVAISYVIEPETVDLSVGETKDYIDYVNAMLPKLYKIDRVSSIIKQTADQIYLAVGNCGLDITNGKILATGDQFQWEDTNHNLLLGLDSSGNATFAGTVKAKILYKGYKLIELTAHPESLAPRQLEDLTNGPLPAVIGIIPMNHSTSGQVQNRIYLPNPQNYEGLELEIYCPQNFYVNNDTSDTSDRYDKVCLSILNGAFIDPVGLHKDPYQTIYLNDKTTENLTMTYVRLQAIKLTETSGDTTIDGYYWAIMSRLEMGVGGDIIATAGGGGTGGGVTYGEMSQYVSTQLLNYDTSSVVSSKIAEGLEAYPNFTAAFVDDYGPNIGNLLNGGYNEIMLYNTNLSDTTSSPGYRYNAIMPPAADYPGRQVKIHIAPQFKDGNDYMPKVYLGCSSGESFTDPLGIKYDDEVNYLANGTGVSDIDTYSTSRNIWSACYVVLRSINHGTSGNPKYRWSIIERTVMSGYQS